MKCGRLLSSVVGGVSGPNSHHPPEECWWAPGGSVSPPPAAVIKYPEKQLRRKGVYFRSQFRAARESGA